MYSCWLFASCWADVCWLVVACVLQERCNVGSVSPILERLMTYVMRGHINVVNCSYSKHMYGRDLVVSECGCVLLNSFVTRRLIVKNGKSMA